MVAIIKKIFAYSNDRKHLKKRGRLNDGLL
jgi:hypothetical protein